MLRDLPLTIDTEMTVAVEKRLSYTCYDVYNPSHRHGGSLVVTPMGKWNRDDGLYVELTQYKYHRRQNLGGLRLNVSIVVCRALCPPVALGNDSIPISLNFIIIPDHKFCREHRRPNSPRLRDLHKQSDKPALRHDAPLSLHPHQTSARLLQLQVITE